jgi:hypothetical protein
MNVKETAQNVFDQNQTSDQFAVSQTSYHTHNGSDSQRIPFKGLSDTPISYHNQKGRSVIVTPNENAVEFSSGILAVTATDGFLAIPTCAGAPTGVPSVGAGAMIFDTTDTKLYIYTGSAWKSVTLT